MVDFTVQDFMLHMLPVHCEQNAETGKAWITETNSDHLSVVRCTDLTYGTGKITVAELELPFTIDDWIEPHINAVSPSQMLLGYPSYIFDVTGQLND